MFVFSLRCKYKKNFEKNKEKCIYCEGEDSYLFLPPPVLFGKSFNFSVQFFALWETKGRGYVQFLNFCGKYAFFLHFLCRFDSFYYLCNAVREQRQPRTFFEMFEPKVKIFINLFKNLFSYDYYFINSRTLFYSGRN